MDASMNKTEFVRLVHGSCSGEVDPVFITAQAILESGWGAHAIGKYNLFGVKRGSWKGAYKLVNTREVLSHSMLVLTPPEKVLSCTPRPDGKFEYRCLMAFRDYSSLEEALKDHEEVLKRFTNAWPFRKDGKRFVEELQRGDRKYATDPNYVKVIISLFTSVTKRL